MQTNQAYKQFRMFARFPETSARDGVVTLSLFRHECYGLSTLNQQNVK